MSRIKRALSTNVPKLFGPEPMSCKLEHQERYGTKPWQPGQIPGMRAGTRILNQPLDIPAPPYGEFFEVEKPVNRGMGYDLKMDVEGKETSRKRGKSV